MGMTLLVLKVFGMRRWRDEKTKSEERREGLEGESDHLGVRIGKVSDTSNSSQAPKLHSQGL